MDFFNAITEVKTNIDSYHKEWYQIALDLANSLDVDERKPRTCGRQRNRDNHPAATVSEYYKRCITLPLVDHLINDLDNWFDIDTMFVYKGLSAIPETLMKWVSSNKQ